MIDISEMFTPQFFNDPEIKKGKVLIFQGDDRQIHLKIVRLNRTKHICMAEETYIYTEDEINAMTKAEAKEIISGRAD